MERNNFLKANVLVIVAVTAILSLLTLKVNSLDVTQERIVNAFPTDENYSIPAEVTDENRWKITPSELPINGIIKKPICYWLKIRI